MKQTILLLGWVLACSSTARPIGVGLNLDKSDEALATRNLVDATEGTIARRGVVRPLTSNRAGLPGRGAAAARPAQNRPGRNNPKANAGGRESNGVNPEGINGHHSSANYAAMFGKTGNTNGTPDANRNGKSTQGPWPGVEAAAVTHGPGYVTMGNDDKLEAEKRVKFKSKGPQDGKRVQGRIAASAETYSATHGSESTASGYNTLAATLENKPGVTGCIECTAPGQQPVKYSPSPDTETFKIIAKNTRPDLGPLKIKATTDGPGATSTAAYNG